MLSIYLSIYLSLYVCICMYIYIYIYIYISGSWTRASTRGGAAPHQANARLSVRCGQNPDGKLEIRSSSQTVS